MNRKRRNQFLKKGLRFLIKYRLGLCSNNGDTKFMRLANKFLLKGSEQKEVQLTCLRNILIE